MEIEVKLIFRKYLFAFASELILINWTDDLSHSCPHRYLTPNFTFAFAFVFLKVINSVIILFRFALISVSGFSGSQWHGRFATRFARSIRANRSQLKPQFSQRVGPIRLNHSNFRFARITRFARIMRIDSRESRH